MHLFKSRTSATSETKAKLIHAIANSDEARFFAGYFSNCEFALVPNNEPKWYKIWTAQKGDVTALIWERGDNVDHWIVKIQCW